MFSNQKVERRPATHLLNILKETSDHHPNFCLFLGAGTSASSGIKTAGEMIRQWRREFHEMYGEEGEGLYDEPSQRREYIESACVKARPSWGYIYLVNLLANNVFNTIFTTNFDDLLNEACYLYSDSVRPIVCAHDSSIRYVRLTSRRPKVIKLHGDFLFDNIKNTVRELETLEDNMKEKFRQYATEFGLIVIGYSGADRSIMDPLKTLVRSEEYFPHGIYWCVRKGEEVSRSVESLCESDKVHLIEISGFDELIADMHERLDYPLQRAVSDPFGSTVARLNSLIHAAGIPTTGNVHPIIARDIAALGHKISDGGGESGGEALLEGITNPSRVLQVPPTPYR
ncbi:MAG: SIR2 family protein, partial [Verrucomicrobiota bacterium]